jgi:hypothetical protein
MSCHSIATDIRAAANVRVEQRALDISVIVWASRTESQLFPA